MGGVHRAGTAMTFFLREVHGRRLSFENTAAQTMGLDNDPLIIVIAADDQTGRLLF